MDVVGGDDKGNIYIASGGAVVTVEDCNKSGIVGGASLTNSGVDNIIGGGVGVGGDENVIHPGNLANIGENKGEKEKSSTSRGGGEAGCGDGVGGGADVAADISANSSGVVGGGGANSVEDVGANFSGGINVSPIPLIPRRRLREILEHAQGECIMCSVFIVCI